MKFILLFITLIYYTKQDFPVTCRALFPSGPDDCNSQNGIGGNCCYLKAYFPSQTFSQCMPYRADTNYDKILTSIYFQSMQYTVQCGAPDPNRLTQDVQCSPQNVFSSTDCYNYGGKNCCGYSFNGFYYCVDKTKNHAGVKQILNELECKAIFPFYSLVIILFNILFILF